MNNKSNPKRYLKNDAVGQSINILESPFLEIHISKQSILQSLQVHASREGLSFYCLEKSVADR